MNVKEKVKGLISSYLDLTYQKKLETSKTNYSDWISKKEEGLKHFDMSLEDGEPFNQSLAFTAKDKAFTALIYPMKKLDASFKVSNCIDDIIVFTNGVLSDTAIPLLEELFETNKTIDVAYGNEDIADFDEETLDGIEEGSRRDPFFKPGWSPNAFLNHFYFGNIVAIRRSTFRDAIFKEGMTGAKALYDMLLRNIFDRNLSLKCRVSHIDEVLIHVKDYELTRLTPEKIRSESDTEYKISIIIPSKDNPHLLKKCMDSLVETRLLNELCELVVVDNGSSLDNKAIIEELSSKYGFTYIYEPSEFNFSKMINRGFENTNGDYLLILNDDITFTEKGTLSKLAHECSLPFTGCVGAKLLYPDSHMIQHAGVFNNRLGPVHKLQFGDDSKEYYLGFNKTVNNVSAVTGACLMIKRKLFEELLGMDEELKVAFNDVDLCFRALEKGYYNAVCNDIFLYHAESVTRGHDTDCSSLERLEKEKKRLYEIHKDLRAFDPFYSKYLISDCLDTRIADAEQYEYGTQVELMDYAKPLGLKKAREDGVSKLSVEYSGKMDSFSYDEADRDFYYIQGFSYVQGSDNSLFKRKLILESKDKCYGFDLTGRLRLDVAESCPSEQNLEMSGFSVKLSKGVLKPGKYRVGMLSVKRFSKEKIFSFSNKYLTVE